MNEKQLLNLYRKLHQAIFINDMDIHFTKIEVRYLMKYTNAVLHLKKMAKEER